jgi:hypothetical protein
MRTYQYLAHKCFLEIRALVAMTVLNPALVVPVICYTSLFIVSSKIYCIWFEVPAGRTVHTGKGIESICETEAPIKRILLPLIIE